MNLDEKKGLNFRSSLFNQGNSSNEDSTHMNNPSSVKDNCDQTKL